MRKWKSHTARAVLVALLGTVVAWALPSAAQVRVMPLGDSLTSSVDGQASYRYWLWNQLQAAGFNVDFVGTQWGVGDGVSAVYPDFDQNHEGHPGATTDDILYGIGDWAAADQPDVVLLLIGSNDFEQRRSPRHALINTHRIINALRAQNPQVVVLWALLPPIPGQGNQDSTYNSGARSMASRLSTRKSPIRIVDLWSGYSPARDTIDGQHPNSLGEKIFAHRFFRLLAPILRRFG